MFMRWNVFARLSRLGSDISASKNGIFVAATLAAVASANQVSAADPRWEGWALSGVPLMESSASPPEDREFFVMARCELTEIARALDGDENAKNKLATILKHRFANIISETDIDNPAGKRKRELFAGRLASLEGYGGGEVVDEACLHRSGGAFVEAVTKISYGLLMGVSDRMQATIKGEMNDIIAYVLSDGRDLTSYLNILERRLSQATSAVIFSSEIQNSPAEDPRVKRDSRKIESIQNEINRIRNRR